MGQRVNVHYSVDLEELPTEVENLIGKAEKKIGECHQELQDLIKRYNSQLLMTTACTQDVNVLRESLANVDFILHDATNIINGFVSYQLQEPPGEDTPAEEALQANAYVDTDHIEEKIQKFKESFST
tara:strand:+ start:90 stop:470 length:381 start_codon:yes stop_codon:yes gene_type:complete